MQKLRVNIFKMFTNKPKIFELIFSNMFHIKYTYASRVFLI